MTVYGGLSADAYAAVFLIRCDHALFTKSHGICGFAIADSVCYLIRARWITKLFLVCLSIEETKEVSSHSARRKTLLRQGTSATSAPPESEIVRIGG